MNVWLPSVLTLTNCMIGCRELFEPETSTMSIPCQPSRKDPFTPHTRNTRCYSPFLINYSSTTLSYGCFIIWENNKRSKEQQYTTLHNSRLFISHLCSFPVVNVRLRHFVLFCFCVQWQRRVRHFWSSRNTRSRTSILYLGGTKF